jgi:hypothetical protein
VRESNTAPAPSPKKMQVRRSFQFRILENASVPMTSTWRYRSGADSIMPWAAASAKTNPAHTELTSNAGQWVGEAPSFS